MYGKSKTQTGLEDAVPVFFTDKAVKKRLAQVLPLVWETIPKKCFEKLWKSMPDRVAAVLEAKGGYPKY